MKVLVTGFEAFGSDTINPSSLLLDVLSKEIAYAKIDTLLLPVVRYKAIEKIKDKVVSNAYDIVLCIGQAAGRESMSVERVGINIDDYRIGDNENNQPIDEVIMKNGQPAYFSDLPIKRMVEASREVNVPAQVSNTAGTYVCNHVLYGVGYLKDVYRLDYRFAFVHVPYLEEQAKEKGYPYLSLEEMKKSIEAMIEISMKHQDDMRKSEGVEC